MKFFCVTAVALCLASLKAAEPVGGPKVDSRPVVVERGANHRVWQRKVEEPVPGMEGKTRTVLKTYTEIAGGLHYLKEGQWIESQEQIELVAGGAVAQRG